MLRQILIGLAAACACAAAVPGFPPQFDGALRVRAQHPRLVFQGSRTFERVRRLNASDQTFRDIFAKALERQPEEHQPALLASCWIVTGDDRWATAAVEALLTAKVTASGSGAYSNVWSFALAYDWLYEHPSMTAEKRGKIAARIIERLESELKQLDDSGMALWHGRNQAANGAMVAALAVADEPGQMANLRRAAAHYVSVLRALDFSEGWPEGPSYWIHNRAVAYPLAADCVITALGTDRIGGIAIRPVMRKIGLWSVYQHTPGGFQEQFGDAFGSLVPGEHGWWEASLDYYARLSHDPMVMAGADYIRNRAATPYGKSRYFQWWVALAYDPAARPKKEYDAAKPELWMRKHFPQSMMFGRNSLGIAFLHGEWGSADEIFASFKAGDMLAHHDHYDTGTFSLQYGGVLVPRTGRYGPGGYEGDYRLGYNIQTVSSNGLLVLAPGETSRALKALRSAHWDALSGGQRVIRPTGFDCLSLEHFRSMLETGPHLKRADMLAWDTVPGVLDYAAADITPAYNSTRWAEAGSVAKVSLVTRQFLFLRKERAFVVYDRVETTRPEYKAKFVMHALAKPEGGEERLLAGNGPEDGILGTDARRMTVTDQRGVLEQVVLLPARSRVLKIGGPNYMGYVEKDGDEANGFNGVNLVSGTTKPAPKGVFEGLWRTELEDAAQGTSVRFLNVLLPRLQGQSPAAVTMVQSGPAVHVVRVGATVVVLAQDNRAVEQASFELWEPAEVIVAGAKAAARYRVGKKRVKADAEGVLRATAPAGKVEISLVQ